jgi:hypothetical protein
MTAALPRRIAETSAVILLGLAFATIQALVGGTRLLFSLPAYGLVAIAALLTLPFAAREKPTPNVLCLGSSAVFFGYLIGRALFSPAEYLARSDLYAILGALIVYAFTAIVFTGAKARLSFLGFLLVCGLVHVFVGAIQFRDGNNFMLIPFLIRADYGRRASGFYVCPNHLAGLLEVIGIFAVSIVCWSRLAVWLKLLIGYAAALCYAGAILTGSRGGYVSIAASFAAFAVLSLLVLRKTGSSLFWKITGAGLLVTLLAAAVVFMSVRNSSFLSQRAGTIADVGNIRFDLWHAAIEQWKLSPVVGTGSGTYLYYGRKFRTDRMQNDPIHVHNDYLQLLCDYGLIAGVLFAGFFVIHLRSGWRGFQRLGPKRVAVAPRLLSNNLALNIGALSSVAAYAVHSVLDFNLHIPANALLLAFVFGVVVNPGAAASAESSRRRQPLLLPRIAMALVALIVLVQCVRLLPGEYYAERARTALRGERVADAISYALTGLTYEKENPDLYANLGRARLGVGYGMSAPAVRASFYRAATEAFEKARALAPMEQGFALTLGMLYDMLGRFEEGEWMLGIARDLDPRSVAVRQYYEWHLRQWQRSGSVTAPATSGG